MDIAKRVGDFYETHPYPPPVDDVSAYRRQWDDARRRAESHLFWPAEPFREDRTILVAGCGTSQAAHYAVRWPKARVVGIDVSARSIEFTEELKRAHGLDNLEVRLLPLERAGELSERFEFVVSTGVLHHLPDPGAGLRALRDVLAPGGALHVMVYAPYGRGGVYMLQEYCRRLGIGTSAQEIRDLAQTLRALPTDHPLVPLLRTSPDFASEAGIADALLHPNDRAYSVPQLLDFLSAAGLAFGRWVLQAPYLPWCGAPANAPHRRALAALPLAQQYAALELFRGTMVRHACIAYRPEDAAAAAVDFDGDAWLDYVPVRAPGAIEVRERLPQGASAVLINRRHTYADLYLPIDARRERLLTPIDGERSIGAIAREHGSENLAREFFRALWRWDQIVLDASFLYRRK